AGLRETSLDPGGVVAPSQARVRELQLQWDGFKAIAGQVDEVEEPEVVPQLTVDGVVVEEVTEVVQHSRRDAVEDVRRVARDEGRARLEQRVCGSADVRTRLPAHVGTPMRCDQHDVGLRERGYPLRQSTTKVRIGDAGSIR